jgi:predicted AAA+ superfamily ATPase
MVREMHQLQAHPQYGPSWEGFCIEQIIRMTRSHERQCFTWSLDQGAEVDLVLEKPQGLFGIECKAGAAPKVEPLMLKVVEWLNLSKLYVVHPGEKDYPLGDKIEAVAFRNLASRLSKLS